MKGIFLFEEILQDKRLNVYEKNILSYYKYFTEQGEHKCCFVPNSTISDYLGIKLTTFKKSKRHLMEMGYIKSIGVGKVVYVGIPGDQICPVEEVVEDTIYPSEDTIYPSEDTIYPSEDTICTHNKEKKEKKQTNKNDIVLDNECNEFVHETKEIVEQTNYDKAYSEIYSNETVIYPEAKEWIRTMYSDTIDKLNSMTPQQYNDSENMIVSFIAGKFKEFKLNKRLEGYGSPR